MIACAVEQTGKQVYTTPLRIDLDFHHLLKKSFATKLVSAIILKDTVQAASVDHRLKPQVLLGSRKNTQHYSDHWSLPIGHVESGESNLQAVIRELKEELSIEALEVTELFVKTNSEKNILHQVFWVRKWRGELVNAEPECCHQIKWFEYNRLPEPITPITVEIVTDFVNSKLFKQTLIIDPSN